MMKKVLLYGLCLLSLTACRRQEKFSKVPYIEFVSINKVDNGTGVDDQANLVFYFQDGDGDIGLNASDTSGVFAHDSTYYYNFFVDYYEKQNGVWKLIALDPSLSARIPHLSEEVPESIKGNITILTYINNYASSYDTIKLSCYLVDRALHISNVMTTPEIVVRK